MDELKVKLKEIVQKVLPLMEEDCLNELVSHLTSRSVGVQSIESLQYVASEDLPTLAPLEKRQLLAEFSRLAHVSTTGNEDRATQPPRRPLVEVLQQRKHKDWDFEINWNDLYNINPKLKQTLKQGKKLKKRDKNEVIKRIVNQVRHNVPGATRSIFVQIVKDLKMKYPASFASELAHGKLGKKSLCYKMKNRFDDSKRPSRRTQMEKEAPSIKAAHGCIKWRLISRPENETEESLKEKQAWLVNHYESTRPTAWEWDKIEVNMEATYGMQRSDINKQAEEIEKQKKKIAQSKRRSKSSNTVPEPDADDIEITQTENIRDKWPFLFESRCMMKHFSTLTGKDLPELLHKYLTEGEGEKIIEYLLETISGKKARKIKKKMKRAKKSLPAAHADIAALLKLLLIKFDEKEEALWIFVDPLAKEEDIPNLCEIPKTPHLIIAGESLYETTNIFFAMDGHVLGTAENFLDAVGLLFGSYFVFNINYDADAQITLEFIQRCIALINPPRGNKRPTKSAGGHFSARQVHPKLTSLDTKYEEFFAGRDDLTSSSESNQENEVPF